MGMGQMTIAAQTYYPVRCPFPYQVLLHSPFHNLVHIDLTQLKEDCIENVGPK